MKILFALILMLATLAGCDQGTALMPAPSTPTLTAAPVEKRALLKKLRQATEAERTTEFGQSAVRDLGLAHHWRAHTAHQHNKPSTYSLIARYGFNDCERASEFAVVTQKYLKGSPFEHSHVTATIDYAYGLTTVQVQLIPGGSRYAEFEVANFVESMYRSRYE